MRKFVIKQGMELLQFLLDQHGSDQEFAQHLGITRTELFDALNKKTCLTERQLTRAAAFFGVDASLFRDVDKQ